MSEQQNLGPRFRVRYSGGRVVELANWDGGGPFVFALHPERKWNPEPHYLVPESRVLELDRARKEIAALKAEIARLRGEAGQ